MSRGIIISDDCNSPRAAGHVIAAPAVAREGPSAWLKSGAEGSYSAVEIRK
jgi:hypothetical protein